MSRINHTVKIQKTILNSQVSRQICKTVLIGSTPKKFIGYDIKTSKPFESAFVNKKRTTHLVPFKYTLSFKFNNELKKNAIGIAILPLINILHTPENRE